MRGTPESQTSLILVGSLEGLVPKEHPLRAIKALADEALLAMSWKFDELYSERGRGSIPPEQLLKGQLLIALYTIRSERQLCEQLRYNFLYRWFLDLEQDSEPFDASSYSKARAKGLFAPEVTGEFFAEVVEAARRRGLLSAEHFSVDGTLLEAWASMKSFRRTDDTDDSNEGTGGPASNRWVDFRGEKRSNATHSSRTDPQARLMRKGAGQASKLSYAAHVLMENRNGLAVQCAVTTASGTCEREAATSMLQRVRDVTPKRVRLTVGADRGLDHAGFVKACRALGVTAHVAQNTHCRSALDGRTTRHAGYRVSLRKRMWIECMFGWGKVVGGLRKLRVRGCAAVQSMQHITMAACNLVRMRTLLLRS